jgi:multidrug efflux pump
MNLSAPFIRRPVGTTLLTAAVALAGAIAFTVLPVAPLPQVDFPTISVNASLPGASAEIMAASVATPLERQFGHIAGVTEMTSSSSLGSTSITLQFDLNRNIDGAARDVQAAINAARTYLPSNLPSNPSYRKVNPADAPILIIALTSDKYEATKLYDLASTVLEQKLSQIQGVGQVGVNGGATPAVRVEVNPTKLESYGLSLANVKSLLSLQNSHEPRGQLADNGRSVDILTNDQISTAADYQPLIVGYHNGSAVRLSDVATVVDSAQNIRTAGYMDGKKGVFLIIFRQPGANIIDTVDRVKSQLPFLEAVLPQGITTTVVMDRTVTIRDSVNNVEQTLLGSVGLVVLVVFLFLRSPRATLIPGVAVPVSLIGTFAAMYLLGYSIDNLSLMALTIATGFVVDDAIVVMENITRHLEAGMEPVAAALQGAREIGFTVFSISMSLIAVFIPILMMGGIVGRLFREFAMTLSIAIVISMVISLTATPCMCAHVLKSHQEGTRHNWFYRASEKVFNGMVSIYRNSLVWVLDNPGLTIVVLLLTIALNVVVIMKIPTGFFPQQDTGAITGGVQGPQDASFPFMNYSVQQLMQIIKSDPAVAHANAYTGGNGASNGGFIYVALKPLGKSCPEGQPGCAVRQTAAMDVLNRIRPKMNKLPIASAFLQPAQDLRIGGRGGNAMYQYTLQSDNISDLALWGPILLDHMKKIPDLQDVNSDQQNGGLRDLLNYDRVTAARLGQTAQSLDNSLYNAFGQSEVSVIYTQLNQYYVVMEVAPHYWQDPSQLGNIDFAASTSTSLAGLNKVSPLLATMHPHIATTPLQVSHTGLFPSVTVSFNLKNGVSLSDATREVTEMERQLGMPTRIRGFFSGTAQAYQQSLSSEWILILTALISVFIVLGILYESLIHPLTIISTVFSASAGAMLALMLFHIDLNVISIIGIILLIGIVKKNAIMMIDFAIQAERAGKSTRDAIFEACLLRFRPIMMTTMAAICGALPLAFGSGTGSELRRPLGITIVGGLILSQLLTLYTTPVVYLLMDKARLWLLRFFFPSRYGGQQNAGTADVTLGA